MATAFITSRCALSQQILDYNPGLLGRIRRPSAARAAAFIGAGRAVQLRASRAVARHLFAAKREPGTRR